MIAQPGEVELLPPWEKRIMKVQPPYDLILINEINWHKRLRFAWFIMHDGYPLLHDVDEVGLRVHNLAIKQNRHIA